MQFGRGGDGAAWQVSGFSHPEAGFTWLLGPRAIFVVPLHPGQGDLLLELSVHAFMAPGLNGQRIGVAVDGTELGEVWAGRDVVLGVRIPAALAADKTRLRLQLTLPDAASPRSRGTAPDGRVLGCQLREVLLHWVAPEPEIVTQRREPLPLTRADSPERQAELVRYVTGLTPPDLLDHFESLGQNCVMGLVQRLHGIEPQGLLRFVSITSPQLWRGLRCGFAGVDELAQLRAKRADGDDPEWMMFHEGYGMEGHTNQFVNRTSEADILEMQARRIGLQHRRFLDVLRGGEKLFVVHMVTAMHVANALPLLHALRSHGPNALLFVTTGGEVAPGSVDLVGPHLFRGHLEKAVPVERAEDYDLPEWLSVCANAYRLWRETGHGTSA
jgi:hypothetical protein